MIIVKPTTKKAQTLLETARTYQGTELQDVYKYCSNRKYYAYVACRAICYEEDGCNFHICSHNAQFFSVAWQSPEGVRIETGRNSYLIEGAVL